MTAAEIIAEVDDHGFAHISATRKASYLNQVVKDICKRQPWPFLEQTLTLTFDGTNPEPSNLPADLRAVISVIDPSSGMVIRHERLDVLEKGMGSQMTAVGSATFFYFVGKQLRFVQIPASTWTARLRYLRKPATLTDASTEAAILVPAENHEVIVKGILKHLYDQEDDPEMGARMEGHYENGIQRMTDPEWLIQYDRPEMVWVMDADEYDMY